MNDLRLYCIALSLLVLQIATSEKDLSSVLVQCSNTTHTTDDDTGLCWKEGASVVCNSLEHGLREAERLGTSMLVENTSQCTTSSRQHEDDCFSNSESSNAIKEENKSEVSQKRIPNITFQNSHCSPGFIPYLNSSSDNETVCMCMEGVRDIVKCAPVGDSNRAFIRDDFCMTYSKDFDSITIASCIFSCPLGKEYLLEDKTSFYFLPYNVSLLQETSCSTWNRQGILCSECRHGYMPLAHSYHLKCIPCELTNRQLALRWMGYLALAVLPQSTLFLLMAIFKVGVTAPPFVSMVQVFQAITTPLYVQTAMKLLSCGALPNNKLPMGLLKSAITFYGFFNLDFFRIVGPAFCLNLNIMQLQLLEYASAFWPLFLIIWTYIFIELHSRGFKPIVLVWKPVQVCLRCFQHEWHMKSSLVETFASFLLLSWIKLLSISYSLLITTCVITVDSNGKLSKDCSRLNYSPTVKLFNYKHFASGIMAISIFIIFIALPLFLLLFYPLKFFQKLINKSGCSFRALHVFMDSFQGSYRDGTDGSTDCRCFSSIYLIIRIILILLGYLCQNRYFFPIASIILMACAVAVGILQPYKRSAHNTFEATLILILAAFYAAHGATSIAQLATIQEFLLPSMILTFLVCILPIIVSIGYLVWWLVKTKRSRAQFCICAHQWWQRRRTGLEDSLPDRVSNPQDYQMVSLPYEEYL